MRAVLKWLAGIAASIIAGVVIWQLTYRPPVSHPPPRDDHKQTQPVAVVCHLAGAVYDQDTHKPLAGIEVHYLRQTRDPNQWIHGVRSRLATTAPDGRFSADCSSVEAENFPLRLELIGPNWHATFQTNEYVRQGERRNNINIYVKDRLLRRL